MLGKKIHGETLLKYGSLGLISFLGLFLPVSAFGQNIRPKHFKNEVHISSSNDNFWPPFYDRYFTNGLDVRYSRILNNQILPGKHRKSIIRFNIGQKLYTSKEIVETNVLKFDRPYAAFLYLRSSLDTFWNSKHNLRTSLISGIIGPKAGGEQVQIWWHKLIHYTRPEGWEYQISNEFVINIELEYLRSWLFSNQFEILSTTGLQTGSSFNNLFIETTVRTGNLLTIDRSAITGSRIKNKSGTSQNQFRSNEWFLFLGFRNTFVLHNSLIEGRLLQPLKSKHTEDAEFHFTKTRAGVAYSTPTFTWMATAHWLGPEVVGGKSHNYASIDMAVRF